MKANGRTIHYSIWSFQKILPSKVRCVVKPHEKVRFRKKLLANVRCLCCSNRFNHCFLFVFWWLFSDLRSPSKPGSESQVALKTIPLKMSVQKPRNFPEKIAESAGQVLKTARSGHHWRGKSPFEERNEIPGFLLEICKSESHFHFIGTSDIAADQSHWPFGPKTASDLAVDIPVQIRWYLNGKLPSMFQ